MTEIANGIDEIGKSYCVVNGNCVRRNKYYKG